MSEIDQNLVHVLSHPLRLEILRQLEKGTGSPKELADRTGQRLANVSYHVRVLCECECIELVRTEPRRGAVEHFYKLKPGRTIGSATWSEVPPALRTHYAGSSLAAFTERVVEALDAGTAESRGGAGLSWLPLTVDEQGWKELCQVRSKVEALFQAVADKSAKRLEASKAGIPAIVAIAAFELASGEDIDSSSSP